MAIPFYAPSDHTEKLRRNLLFTAALCIIHFAVTSLNDLIVMSVKLPNWFIGTALPVCMLWFAVNYFYFLYAEFHEWRLKYAREPIFYNDLDKVTLITEFSEPSNNEVEVTLSLASTKVKLDQNLPDLADSIQMLLRDGKREIQNFIEADLAKIAAYQASIEKYTWASKGRFLVIDYGIPLLLTFVAVGYWVLWPLVSSLLRALVCN